jgi:4-amino-4-deoxy-L-arabinose transferase-like glycosyltransferase
MTKSILPSAIPTAGTNQGPKPLLIPRLSLILCALLLLGFFFLWLRNLDTFSEDYNEGVYLCSARMALHGHPPFSSVFSSQPPAFLDILTVAFGFLGDSVVVGRGVIIFFSLVSLGAVAWIAWQILSPLAGPLAMLFLGLPLVFFHQARTVQAEIPALACALVALGALVSSFQAGRSAGLVGAGFFFALGVMCKLLVAPLIVPVVWLLVPAQPWQAPLHWGALGSSLGSRAFVGRTLLFALGGVAACALTLWPYPLTDLYDQMVQFHLQAKIHFPLNRSGNLRMIRDVLWKEDLVLTLAAAAGFFILLWQRPRAALWLGVWVLPTFIFLIDHAPLFPRHVVLLLPPLAVAASSCVLLVNVLWRSSWSQPLVFALVLPLAWLLGKMLVRDLPIFSRGIPSPRWEQDAMRLIEKHTQPTDFVVSDQQMQVFRAGRQTPPQLCDTSFVRIQSGYLTDKEAIAASENARMIIFWTGRLGLLRRYSAWVEAHYRPVLSDGPRRVFVRD